MCAGVCTVPSHKSLPLFFTLLTSSFSCNTFFPCARSAFVLLLCLGVWKLSKNNNTFSAAMAKTRSTRFHLLRTLAPFFFFFFLLPTTTRAQAVVGRSKNTSCVCLLHVNTQCIFPAFLFVSTAIVAATAVVVVVVVFVVCCPQIDRQRCPSKGLWSAAAPVTRAAAISSTSWPRSPVCHGGKREKQAGGWEANRIGNESQPTQCHSGVSRPVDLCWG